MTRFNDYYTVFVEYPKLGRFSGAEAIVDPTLTRKDIIERLRSGEYGNGETSHVVQIDHTADGLTVDVTHELIDAAEQAARALEAV